MLPVWRYNSAPLPQWRDTTLPLPPLLLLPSSGSSQAAALYLCPAIGAEIGGGVPPPPPHEASPVVVKIFVTLEIIRISESY